MEFVTWEILGSSVGALTMVLAITQITKKLSFVQKIPTQLWSWIIALAVLYLAYHFTGQLSASTAAIVPLNAALVALASNGGFEVLSKVFGKKDE